MTYAGFVIPVYNTSPEILGRTLNDLLKQTTLPIYVVDDGSTRKETLDLLRTYEKSGKVQVIYHERNRGKVEALATGVREGNITYPFFIDDDITIMINNKNEKNFGKDLDEIIEEEISILNRSDKYVCVVYPVGARNKDENLLTRIQHLEHIISTYYIRKFLGSSIYVNGSGCLWKSSGFLDVYRLHSKRHAADDLEISLILYRLNKEAIFSENLILLAHLKDTFKGWFRQRISWEYGKWTLFKRYWKEILKNPNTFTYYFASPFLLLSFLTGVAGVAYSALSASSILSKRPYTWSNKRRAKETLIYIPFLGLSAYIYPPILLAIPIYYYLLFKSIGKSHEVREDVPVKDAIELIGYSLFYLTVIQPAGIVYSVYRKLKGVS